MPIPPPPPGGPPTLSQVDAAPPNLNTEDAEGRGALLSDVCKGTELKAAAAVNDGSESQTPPADHPYVRLYQYLHQQPSQQGAPCEELQRTAGEQSSAPSLEKPKGGGASDGAAGSPLAGGVPKLRPVGDGSTGRSPSTRAAAPRPPNHRRDDTDSPSPQATSPMETSRTHRPSLPNLSSSPSPSFPSSGSIKHSSSAPPPPPLSRRGNAPSPPASAYNREKALPPTPNNTPPLPSKPPPSPGNSRRPLTSGGSSASTSSSSLAPPPPPYRITNGPTGGGGNEAAPELPQRHNSLSNKRTAPSPGSHTPSRGPAPPPPASPTPSTQGINRPPPPTRGVAPPVPSQSSRAGGREAPPPPPHRTHGSPSLSSDTPARGKPPPPPTRTPAAPPPPPPPLRNGHSSSIPRSFVDDFESKYSFHPLDDFPPPDEYRHFDKIYPSKASRVIRGAPPLPPVGR
ncbi:WAS/WASL-interacting protein family member 2-like [Brachionichthys hirsutus]|uniref:WAS/WASL-interacting protein family member 2-like n=1 Tax=Brachionichthys hirsutus TaxID=412623 RepID=UPI0036051573